MGFWQQAANWQGNFWQDLSGQGSWRQESWRESWRDIAARARRLTADESGLRRKFWRKLLREASHIPFLEDVLTAHYCAFDRQTPLYVKTILIGAIVYFVLPDDLIPDYIPVIGYADDAAVLGAAFKVVASHIKPEHREAARRMLERLREEHPSRV